MQQSAHYLGVICLGACLLLAGCAGGPRSSPTPNQAAAEASPATQQPTPVATAAPVSARDSDWVPPLFMSPEEEASYYVSRLADRRFVASYGDRDNRRPWYIAAERLGEIGLPAVHLLFARLNTRDAYEQMLVLYALQLATQDPQLMARTRGDYVQLGVVLDPAYNADNVETAQQWWQQYASVVSF